MKSSIKIDFVDKGRGIEPAIIVSLVDSDDMRDKMLKTLFQSLGMYSMLGVCYRDSKLMEGPTILEIVKPYSIEDLSNRKEVTF